MRYFFFENFTLRVLSLFVAVIGWFYVNIIVNPVTERQFEVDLILAEKRSDCLYRNIPQKATVFIRGGRRDIIENYFPVKTKIAATVNVAKATSDVPNRLPVNFMAPRGLELVKVEPREIEITPILMDEHTAEVQVKTVGEPRSGYYVKSAVPSSKFVYLRGPQKLIGARKNIGATVKVDGMDSGFTARQTLIPVEVTANENSDITISPKDIDINVDIAPLPARPVTVVPNVRGKVAAGYAIDTIECEPASVLVKGALEKIEKLKELKTEVIDVSDATHGISLSARIAMPENPSFTLENGQVSVTVRLKQLYRTQRYRDVAVELPKIADGYEIVIEKRSLDVEINAPAPRLAELSTNKFILSAKLPDDFRMNTGPVSLELSILGATAPVDVKPSSIKGTVRVKQTTADNK